jgi:hypothetical protein
MLRSMGFATVAWFVHREAASAITRGKCAQLIGRGTYNTPGIQSLLQQRNVSAERIRAQWIRATITPLRRSASCHGCPPRGLASLATGSSASNLSLKRSPERLSPVREDGFAVLDPVAAVCARLGDRSAGTRLSPPAISPRQSALPLFRNSGHRSPRWRRLLIARALE